VLLVVALSKGHLGHVKAFIALGVPIVCLDRKSDELKVDSATAGIPACSKFAILLLERITGKRDQPTDLVLPTVLEIGEST